MSRPAIIAEGLAKQYHLGVVGATTLRADAARFWRQLTGAEPAPEAQDFWALRDVAFQINAGELVGVIGRNGAGKSTLLKILSRITEPTAGTVRLRGRTASLLEVGTGFHPELTGRENVFLNGAILGMKRAEIAARFDAIVAFSEVERFIDTPVKHYSSGMRVRLAFSVAAHLDSEILILDEVLAVGDASFQNRCLARIEALRTSGRTILLVSHNLQAISTYADRALVLDAGRVVAFAPVDQAIDRYLDLAGGPTGSYTAAPDPAAPAFTSVAVRTSNPGNVHAFGQPFAVEFELDTPFPLQDAALSLVIENEAALRILHLLTLDREVAMCRTPGRHRVVCSVPRLRLYPGRYYLTAHFSGTGPAQRHGLQLARCVSFSVEVLSELREHYWHPHGATYVEDAAWAVTPPA